MCYSCGTSHYPTRQLLRKVIVFVLYMNTSIFSSSFKKKFEKMEVFYGDSKETSETAKVLYSKEK